MPQSDWQPNGQQNNQQGFGSLNQGQEGTSTPTGPCDWVNAPENCSEIVFTPGSSYGGGSGGFNSANSKSCIINCDFIIRHCDFNST